jgi:hypothetical protein
MIDAFHSAVRTEVDERLQELMGGGAEKDHETQG